MGVRLLSFTVALSMVTLSSISNAQVDDSLVQRGFDISPVPMAQLTFTEENSIELTGLTRRSTTW